MQIIPAAAGELAYSSLVSSEERNNRGLEFFRGVQYSINLSFLQKTLSLPISFSTDYPFPPRIIYLIQLLNPHV